jgi:hypothetical protein
MEALADRHRVSVPFAYKGKLQLDPSIPFKVNFGGDATGLTEDGQGIAEIYQFICETVLPRFLPFFP